MVPWSFRSVLNALVEHSPADVYDKAVKILEDELQPWEGLRDLIEGDGAAARMERVARNLQAEQLEVTADMLLLAVRLILGIEPRKREGQAQVVAALLVKDMDAQREIAPRLAAVHRLDKLRDADEVENNKELRIYLKSLKPPVSAERLASAICLTAPTALELGSEDESDGRQSPT